MVGPVRAILYLDLNVSIIPGSLNISANRPSIGTNIIAKSVVSGTDIYLVDTYGEAYKFYGISSLAFLGGSLIPHGGQNPLEPAREGNYIIYGPNIDNFKEVYEMLKKLRIASKVKTINKMKDIVSKKINYKQKKIVNKKLYNEGIKILNKNFIEINKYI